MNIIARFRASASPRALVALSLALALPAVVVAQTSPDRARLATAIDSLANAAIAHGPLSALTVGIMRGNDVELLRGYGLADREKKTPAAPATIFKIGSITKQFTALAILQLAEQGKLSLDDDLSKWLPEFPMRGRHIPISMLLQHTSGIKNYTELGPAYMRDSFTVDVPHARLVRMFANRPDDFAPGTDFNYTNSPFFLAGMIVEKASGQSYGDYLKTHIFGPVGMTSSSYCDDKQPQGRAVGYAFDKGALAVAPPISMTVPFSAGALCSNVPDLLRYQRALLDKKIVNAQSWQRMITPATLADGFRTSYGFGLVIDDDFDGERVIGHGGQINGFWASLMYYPSRDLTVAVLSNVNPAGGEPLWTIAERMARVAMGKSAAKVTPAIIADSARLARYAGTYEVAHQRLTLAVRGRTASLGGLGPQPVPLSFQGNDTFLADGDLLFRFQLVPGATPAADRARVRFGFLPINMRALRVPADSTK